MRIMRQAETDGDHRLALLASRECRENLKLITETSLRLKEMENTAESLVTDTSPLLLKLQAAQLAYSSGPAPAQPQSLAVEVVGIDGPTTDV